MNNSYSPQPSAAPVKTKSRTGIIIAIVAIVVVCCCLVAAIGGYFLYQGGYLNSIMGRLFGGAEPVAKVMPEDTDVYMSIDFLKVVINTDYDSIINAFAENASNPDIRNKQDIIRQIDDTLDSSLGVNLSDDIFPWIGTYVGLGFSDFRMDDNGSPQMDSWVLAIQARDKTKADDFIQKVVQYQEDQSGENFDSEDYQGATIYYLEEYYSPMAITRSNDIVYLSTDRSDIKKAIDAQRGNGLSNNAAFKDAMSSLPSNREMTLYAGPEVFDEIAQYSSPYSSYTFGSLDIIQNAGLALSVVDAGLKLDLATVYKMDQLSDQQRQMLEQGGGNTDIAQYYPADTLIFLAGNHLDNAWVTYRDLIVNSLGSSSDFEDSMSMAEDQIGFNPDTELFPLLDGAYALGVYEDNDSILNQNGGIPLGFLGVFETSQTDQMNNLVANFTDSMDSQRIANVNENSTGNLTYYELEENVSSDVILGYGLYNRYLMLGTNGQTLEQATQNNDSLGQNTKFKDVWGNFSGMKPVLYIDLAGIIDMAENLTGENLGILTPIDALAAASSNLSGSSTKTSIILFISK
jgi:hypothetical protein